MNNFDSFITALINYHSFLQALILLLLVATSETLGAVIRRAFRRFAPTHPWLIDFSPVLSASFVLGMVWLLGLVFLNPANEDEKRLIRQFFFAFWLLCFFVFVGRRIIERFVEKESTLALVNHVVKRLFWIIILLYISNVWLHWGTALKTAEIVLGNKTISVLTVLEGLVLVVATTLMALWIASLIDGMVMRMDDVEVSRRVMFSRLGRVLIVLIALLFGMSFAGVDITLLSVFSGAFGIGIALGLQRVFGNYIYGLILLIEKSIAIDDYIETDKVEGYVKKISTRYSLVRSAKGVDVVVPNETLILQPVRNFGVCERPVPFTVNFYIDLKTDVHRALAVAISAARSVREVVDPPAPDAFLNRVLPLGYEIILEFWVRDHVVVGGRVKSDVNLAVLDAFRKEGISLATSADNLKFLPNP